jgi:hypothetical protein
MGLFFMIIVRLIGGIGNQLFQYAVARHLAEIHKTILKIDLSGFGNYKLRKYYLSPFNIQENFATLEEIKVLGVYKQEATGRLIARILKKPPKLAPTHILEKHFHFDPEILRLPDGVYLDGYWQSEKYFKDIEDIIRQEFTVKTSQDSKNKELSELIASCESVSLHIRRGDFVSNFKTKRVHGICDLDYYSRAVKQITQTVNTPYFFVFSDEPEWARDNLKLSYQIKIVDHNGVDKSHEDLRLMSQCKYHIIANSTFSWWGAWLNARPEKIVIAPKKWFNTNKNDTKDLLSEQCWTV